MKNEVIYIGCALYFKNFGINYHEFSQQGIALDIVVSEMSKKLELLAIAWGISLPQLSFGRVYIFIYLFQNTCQILYNNSVKADMA